MAPSKVAAPLPSVIQAEVLARCDQIAAYGGQTSRQAVRLLIDALGDPAPLVRWQASQALARTVQSLLEPNILEAFAHRDGDLPPDFTEMLAWMRQALTSDNSAQRAATAEALGHWPHPGAVALLLEALEDPSSQVRASAARALGRLGAVEAVEVLIAALNDPSLWVRIASAQALGALGDAKAVAPLAEAARIGPVLLRVAAIASLGHFPSKEARRVLEECLADENGSIRWYAARGLGHIGNTSALPSLERLLGDKEALFGTPIYRVAQEAIQAIRQREQGTWHAIRHLFSHFRGWLRRLF